MKNFGARLRAERVRMHLTQRELAHLCGVQANAQVKYESGERHPGSGYLIALSCSGVDVMYVLAGQRPVMTQDETTEKERSVIAHYRAMTDKDQEAMGQLVMSLWSTKDRRLAPLTKAGLVELGARRSDEVLDDVSQRAAGQVPAAKLAHPSN